MRGVTEKPVVVRPEPSGGAYSEKANGILPGMLEGSDDLFAAIDRDMKLVAYNAALRRAIHELSGVAPQLDAPLGPSLACFAGMADTVLDLCRRALEGEVFHLTLDFLGHEASEPRFVDATLSPIRNAAGAVVVVVMMREVTERKNAERASGEEAAKLRLALRAGASGTFDWDLGTQEFRLGEASLDLFGLRPEEFGGQHGNWLACLLPEDRGGALSAMMASLETGDYVAEFRIRRRSDDRIRWISARGQVFHDPQGKPAHMLGMHIDVTDERRIRTDIELSRTRLRTVLNSLDEAVILFDAGGRVIETNPAALENMGLRTPEQARLRVDQFAATFDLYDIDGRRLSVDEWPLNRVLRGEAFNGVELHVHRKPDNVCQTISYNGSPIRSADGTIEYGLLTLVDISDRKRGERALQDSERRLALALEAGSTAVWELDVFSQAIQAVDDRLCSMLGYAPHELGTRTEWMSRIHDDDRPRVESLLDEIVRGERDSSPGVEMRYRTKSGAWHWILCQAVVAERNAQGKAIRLVGTHTDIHARKQAEEKARQASLHDPLTGLPNRALVFEFGSRLLAAARRNHGRGALLFVDLDRFKPINDQYGHEVGDRVLQEVGQRLVDCTRSEDLVGRLGGDEFVVILAHLDKGLHRAAVVAQHVVDALSRPIPLDGLELSISPSIGISCFPEHADSVEQLIHAADLAMYQVKQSSRANYQFYSTELGRKADTMFRLEARIKDALRNGRLELHYQPVLDVRSGDLISAEALVRLADDGGESGGPASFIPIAESTGLIGPLGEWVATEACRQHRLWRSEGMSVTIAINVSPLQFRRRDFPERLRSIIAEAGVAPSALQLEITETAAMESDDDATETLNRIRSLGVKIALDDFGTGYSNLSRLSRLPLDKLKVDQSFLRGIAGDPACRAVTEAIIALGRNLRLDVVGEGIESEEALRYLEAQGCDQAQGFWFSQPLPAEAFASWYRERQAVH